MNLADVSAFDVARLAAAAFGWGLVCALWGAIGGAMSAILARQIRDLIGPITIRAKGDDDTTPPGPPASA